MQGEKNCTYGYLTPNLVSLRNKLIGILSEGRLEFCQPLIKGLLDALDKRFKPFFNVEDEGETAAVAAVVHPKFKGLWLQCLSDDAQQKVKQLVLKEIAKQPIKITAPTPAVHDDFYDFGSASSNGLNAIFDNGDEKNELQTFLQDSSC